MRKALIFSPLSSALFAIMNNSGSEKVSDLYAVIDKSKTKKCINQEGIMDDFPLYSVVNKKKNVTKSRNLEESIDSADLYATVDKNRKNGNLRSTEQHNINEERLSPVKSTIHNQVDCSNSFIKSATGKTTLMNTIWSIAAAVMVILIVIFVITTAIGFTKVSSLQFQFLSTKFDQDLNVSASPTSNTEVIDSSTNMNFLQNQSLNQSATPSFSTEDMESSTPAVNRVLSNYSHLQQLFDTNNILLQFFSYCNSKGDLTQSQCVDSVLSIYGRYKILPAKSCKELNKIVPHNSGYYWVKASDGSTNQVYCDMTVSCGNMTGGLTRIATLNPLTKSQYCTGDISVNDVGCYKTSPMPGCSEFVFSMFNLNLSYSHICGTVEGSYFGTPEGFAGSGRSSTTIDNNYVDGISLTWKPISQNSHMDIQCLYRRLYCRNSRVCRK